MLGEICKVLIVRTMQAVGSMQGVEIRALQAWKSLQDHGMCALQGQGMRAPAMQLKPPKGDKCFHCRPTEIPAKKCGLFGPEADAGTEKFGFRH